MKRKQKKGGNLSIHKFDEATQRSIEITVRQNLNEFGEEQIIEDKPSTDDVKAAVTDKTEKTTQDAPVDKVEINKNIEGAAQPLATFSIVEDHIKDNYSPQQKDSNSMGETIKKIEIASDFIEENVKIEE